MKRHAFKLFVFLVAGAFINVAVAWGLPAISGRATWNDVGPPNVADIEWCQATAPAGREVSDAPVRVIRNNGFGFQTASMIEVRRTEPNQPKGHTCQRKMLGWPMLALQSTIWEYEARSVDLRGIVFFLGKDWPAEPIFPGLAINTIFYAAIVWTLFFAPRAIRRRIRIKRGQCAACGYSLRDNVSEKCPECGAAVRVIR